MQKFRKGMEQILTLEQKAKLKKRMMEMHSKRFQQKLKELTRHLELNKEQERKIQMILSQSMDNRKKMMCNTEKDHANIVSIKEEIRKKISSILSIKQNWLFKKMKTRKGPYHKIHHLKHSLRKHKHMHCSKMHQGQRCKEHHCMHVPGHQHAGLDLTDEQIRKIKELKKELGLMHKHE